MSSFLPHRSLVLVALWCSSPIFGEPRRLSAPPVSHVAEDESEELPVTNEAERLGSVSEILDATDRLADAADLEAARTLFSEFAEGDLCRSLFESLPDEGVAEFGRVVQTAERLQLGELFIRLSEQGFERMLSLRADHPTLVWTARTLMRAQHRGEEFSAAKETVLWLCAVYDKHRSPDDSDRIGMLSDLAYLHTTLGEFSSARDVYAQVVDSYERTQPPGSPDLLRAKRNLARTCERLGEFSRSAELQSDVLAAQLKALPVDHPEIIETKRRLSEACRLAGDAGRALEIAQDALDSSERSLPQAHPVRVEVMVTLAHALELAGRQEDARVVEVQICEALSTQLPEDHPRLLAAHANLADTLRQLGRLTEAKEEYERVVVGFERAGAAGEPNGILARQGLASTLAELGDFAGGLQLRRVVLEEMERQPSPDLDDLHRARHNLVISLRHVGDFEGALELAERVHAYFGSRGTATHHDLLRAKGNLSRVRKAVGDFEGAIELTQEVLTVREATLPPHHHETVVSRQNLATLLAATGRHSQAHDLFESVLLSMERLYPPHFPLRIEAVVNLAMQAEKTGDPNRARELYESAVRTFAKVLPRDHPHLIETELKLARSYRTLRDQEPKTALVKSVLERQVLLAATLRLESPRVSRAGALLELSRLSRAMSQTRSREPERSEGALALDSLFFDALESLRAVSTASSEFASMIASTPDLAARRDRLVEARRLLNAKVASPPRLPEELESWRKQLFDLATQRDDIQRELRAELSRRGLPHELPTSGSVARGLDSGAALLSYFRAQPARNGVEGDALVALVLTPDGAVRRVELGRAQPLEELATRWRGALGSPLRSRGVTASPASSTADELDIGQELYERVVAPCLAAIPGPAPSQVHVIPDDFLHLIPFGALPKEGQIRLRDSIVVYNEISALRLVSGARPPASAGTLVAMGGIDYEADARRSEHGSGDAPPLALTTSLRAAVSGKLSALPHAGLEVRALSELYPGGDDGEAVVLTGAGATKRALEDLAPQARYLHLATHGWFAPESVSSMADSRSGVELAESTARRATEAVHGFAPETLCGLALAGANGGADPSGEVPGIITGEELSTLDLSACELAVLSACETNVGIRRAGQGIQSLRSALHAAGARTTITSLWKVDDAATRELMETFYSALWNDGLGKGEALWRAKVHLREEGHPLRDWAGWILTGSPD